MRDLTEMIAANPYGWTAMALALAAALASAARLVTIARRGRRPPRYARALRWAEAVSEAPTARPMRDAAFASVRAALGPGRVVPSLATVAVLASGVAFISGLIVPSCCNYEQRTKAEFLAWLCGEALEAVGCALAFAAIATLVHGALVSAAVAVVRRDVGVAHSGDVLSARLTSRSSRAPFQAAIAVFISSMALVVMIAQVTSSPAPTAAVGARIDPSVNEDTSRVRVTERRVRVSDAAAMAPPGVQVVELLVDDNVTNETLVETIDVLRARGVDDVFIRLTP